MHGSNAHGPLGGGRGPGQASHIDADGRHWQGPQEAVPISEPNKGPWINSNGWGLNHLMQLPQVPPNVTGEPALQTEGVQIFQDSGITPGPPRRMNVILTRQAFQPAGSKVMCWAKLRIGIGGIVHTVACDWPATGIEISIPMSTLYVAAIFAPLLAGGLYNPDLGAYSFGVMLARAGGSAQNQLHFTSQAQAVAPGSNAVFDIPRFAKRAYLMPSATGFFVVDSVAQWTGGGTFVGTVLGTQATPASALPVPNFATQLTVSTGTYNGNLSIVWEIEI